MHKYIIAGLMACSILEAIAQQFQPRLQLPLNDTANYSELRWADLDNDSLLDVALMGTTDTGEIFFSFYKNNSASVFEHQNIVTTDFRSGNFILADYNNDNLIDIVITGSTAADVVTRAYLNQENFEFTEQMFGHNGGAVVKMADMDGDGGREVILSGSESGNPFVTIWKQFPGEWRLMYDSISVEAMSIEVFDFDKDGANDLFISGKNATEQPVTQLYRNRRNYYFTEAGPSFAFRGRSSVSDLDHDGRLDILLSGVDDESNPHSVMILNKEAGFTLDESFPDLSAHSIFTGDFNSDGQCDISLYGVTAASDSLNLICDFSGDYDTLHFPGIRAQQFGDFDRDGDLDLVQLFHDTEVTELRLLENSTLSKNLAPVKPSDPIGFRVFNTIFVFWSPATDDHTPPESLTYDVTVQEEGSEPMSATFDLVHGKQLIVNHGNTGTTNYILMRSGGFGSFNYLIQAVDNAYHAEADGICAGTMLPCDGFQTQQLEVCRYESTTLSAPVNSSWFSLQAGLLHTGPEYNFITSKADTIFSVTPQPGACPLVTVYTIAIVDTKTISEVSTLHVCEGMQLAFQAESGWEQILWSSIKKGVLSNEDTFVFQVTEADTVKVELSDGGCSIERATAINISKPELVLGEVAYQVMRGESVQLNAGGGQAYVWSPASGLDDPAIADPVATPAETTEYRVTVIDSIGCTVEGRVLVIVEETAFIPNLFTPNDDGKNDALKAYGLGTVTNFSFSIYNREGNLVYSTQSTSELTGTGWNGMVRGVKQPSGVYYWKVKGENHSGKNTFLNGKETGSIMLIR